MNQNLFDAKWDCGVSIKDISHSELASRGIKALLLDVDGTLLPRQEYQLHESVEQWVKQAKKFFRIELISNNLSKKRISLIANELKINYTYKASKPRKEALINSINSINYDKLQVAIIGDRILTDIVGGNRIGIYTILVKGLGSNGETINNNKIQYIEKQIARILGVFLK